MSNISDSYDAWILGQFARLPMELRIRDNLEKLANKKKKKRK